MHFGDVIVSQLKRSQATLPWFKRLPFAAACVWMALAGHVEGAGPTRDDPTLVVVVSVDQWAYEYFDRFKDNLQSQSQGIVGRVRRDGVWFTNCNHMHAFTFTGPGHAVQLTGCYPSLHGIIDNQWYDRTKNEVVYCVRDNGARALGDTAAKGSSPRQLVADTLGDRMKLASDRRSRVFGVALKDRAAILMTGKLADAAFWASESGFWITSDYYRNDLPGYFRVLNEQDSILRYAEKTWELSLPSESYRHRKPERSEFELPIAGMTKDFPHKMPPMSPRETLAAHVAVSPFGNELTLEAARTIVEEEQLGLDGYPDLLCVNLSSNDYVGHAFGPYSLEVEDMNYRTNRQLADFADQITKTLEGRPWLMVITADHGVAPIPEWAAKRKLGGMRDPLGKPDAKGLIEPLRQEIETYLRTQLPKRDGESLVSTATANGESADPSLVLAATDHEVFLRIDHPLLKGETYFLAQRLVRRFLINKPHVAVAATREQLLDGGLTGKIELALRRSFHAERSGDVLFAMTPYSISGTVGASHGSPWKYDTNVPLFFLPQGKWNPKKIPRKGIVERPVSPASIAPTLARILSVQAPSMSVEEPLYDILAAPE